VADFSPHGLRRSYICDLLDAGADPRRRAASREACKPLTATKYDRRPKRRRSAPSTYWRTDWCDPRKPPPDAPNRPCSHFWPLNRPTAVTLPEQQSIPRTVHSFSTGDSRYAGAARSRQGTSPPGPRSASLACREVVRVLRAFSDPIGSSRTSRPFPAGPPPFSPAVCRSEGFWGKDAPRGKAVPLLSPQGYGPRPDTCSLHNGLVFKSLNELLFVPSVAGVTTHFCA
jgi:hypothetical protein